MNEEPTNEARATGAGLAAPPLGEVIRIDEGVIKEHLDQVVEQTLNALLAAEADRLCGAKRYAHLAGRVDTRAGHYERQLHTKAGEVTLKMPQAAQPAIRKRDHRALQMPGDQRRGGAGRDVFGRRFGPAG